MKKQSWKDWLSQHGYLFIAIGGTFIVVCLGLFFWDYLVYWNDRYPALVRGLAAPVLAAPIAIAALQLAAKRTKEMNQQNEIALGQSKTALKQNEAAKRQNEIVLKRNEIEDSRNTIDILSRALEQVGNKESLVMRQGGVILLRRLGETAYEKGNKLEKEMIINTLASFVRTQAPLPKKKEGEKELPPPKDRKDRLDVENAIKTLASITEGIEERQNVDLSFTDLRGLHLSVFGKRTNLSFFNLAGANLSDAWLEGANLSKAELGRADLSNASLRFANLSAARLGRSKNLTDHHIDKIRYYKNHPPTLPADLNLPQGDENIILKGDFDYNEKELERLDELKRLDEEYEANL